MTLQVKRHLFLSQLALISAYRDAAAEGGRGGWTDRIGCEGL